MKRIGWYLLVLSLALAWGTVRAGQPDPLANLALTTTSGWSFWLPDVQK